MSSLFDRTPKVGRHLERKLDRVTSRSLHRYRADDIVDRAEIRHPRPEPARGQDVERPRPAASPANRPSPMNNQLQRRDES